MKLLKKKSKIDLIGFHGQTIFHNAKEKISKQLVMENFFQNLQKKLLFMILDKMI